MTQPSPVAQQETSRDRLLALLPYVGRFGWRLVWLNGKRPGEAKWPTVATTEPEILDRWAAFHPSANWGIATGAGSNLDVLDVDGAWAANEIAEMEARHGRIIGPRVRTGGGGFHIYMLHNARLRNGMRVTRPNLGKGEILYCGNGRQVVAAGSWHPDTGKPYNWLPGCSPEEQPLNGCPEWLVTLLSGSDRPPSSPESVAIPLPTRSVELGIGTATAPSHPGLELEPAEGLVHQGGRNYALHAFVCSRVFETLGAGREIEAPSIWEEVKVLNHTGFCPPMPESELRDRFNRSLLRAQTDYMDKHPPKAARMPGLGNLAKAHSGVGAFTEWSEPVAFEFDSGPPFPMDALTGAPWLSDYVAALAATFQVPVDMVAMLTVAVVAGAIQGRTVVTPKDGWLEPTGLYVVTAAEPGSNKSQVHSRIMRPIMAWESRCNALSAPDRRVFASTRKAIQARLEKLEKKAGGIDDTQERQRVIQEMATLRQELEATPTGDPLQMVYDDATSEILERGMAANQGVAIIASPEGRIFDQMAGGRDGHININIYLKGHSCDPLRVNRITRDSVLIDRPRLTTIMAVQPDVVSGLAARREFAGRGLLARMLFVIPTSNIGFRNIDPPPVPGNVEHSYSQNIERLFEEVYERGGAEVRIRFTTEATDLFREFRVEVERRLAPDANDLNGMAGWAAKLAGHTARIAASLHVAGCLDRWESTAITGATMERAVLIARFLVEHARVAFGLMNADPVLQDCRYLLRHLVKRSHLDGAGNHSCSRLSVWQQTKRHFRSAEGLDNALSVLATRGYIVARSTGGLNGRQGQVYLINPAVMGDTNTSPASPRSTYAKPCQPWTSTEALAIGEENANPDPAFTHASSMETPLPADSAGLQ